MGERSTDSCPLKTTLLNNGCIYSMHNCKVNLNNWLCLSALSLHLFTLQCEKDAGMGLHIFTFTFMSSLTCLHTFWRAIPTSFYIFIFLLAVKLTVWEVK